MKTKKVFLIIYCLLLAIFNGCKTKNDENIDILLKSKNSKDKMLAYFLIGENKDKNYIDSLIYKLDDSTISNSLKFKGMSIYQSKIIALKKITGINPPHKITYKPDSINIKFYLNWVKMKK